MHGLVAFMGSDVRNIIYINIKYYIKITNNNNNVINNINTHEKNSTSCCFAQVKSTG